MDFFFLLDPKPYELKVIENSGSGTCQSFKVSTNTLAHYTAIGPGSYGMSVLKRMTGTKSFEQLPIDQKKCLVHNREECQTQKYLDQVQRECNCTPWALKTDQDKNQVKSKHIIWTPFEGVILLWPREGELCCKPNLERQKLFGSLYWSLC